MMMSMKVDSEDICGMNGGKTERRGKYHHFRMSQFFVH
jgi:hypothetical protein